MGTRKTDRLQKLSLMVELVNMSRISEKVMAVVAAVARREVCVQLDRGNVRGNSKFLSDPGPIIVTD